LVSAGNFLGKAFFHVPPTMYDVIHIGLALLCINMTLVVVYIACLAWQCAGPGYLAPSDPRRCKHKW